MPWPPACRPRTGPRRRRTGARQYHGRPSSESRRTLRSPDSIDLSQEGLVFAGGDDFVRPVVDARATIESEPVVRKSSEVLRLVDDVVDAALILDVNLGVRAHLRDHRGVARRVGRPGRTRRGPTREASRSCRALAVGGDRWHNDCVCVGVCRAYSSDGIVLLRLSV